MAEIWHVQIDPASAGQPLHELLRASTGAPVLLEMALQRGGVWVNGRREPDLKRPARSDMQVQVHFPPDGRYRDTQLGAAQILYDDQLLLAIDKPAGSYVGATAWDDHGHVLAAVGAWLRAQGRLQAPRLAHQLDRDTSGVLLFSLDPRMDRPLQALFDHGQVHKTYFALVAGHPAPAAELQTGHGRAAGGRFRLYPLEEIGRGLPDGSRVRLAHTRYQVESYAEGCALLRVELLTGRTHQIRLHLAEIGHPLLGDARYGGPLVYAGQHLPRHMLHAAQLELPHPHSAAPLRLLSRLPDCFQAIIGAGTQMAGAAHPPAANDHS